MSDEQRRDDETEVESHLRRPHASDEPADEGEDDDVEGHVRKPKNVRMDSPSHI